MRDNNFDTSEEEEDQRPRMVEARSRQRDSTSSSSCTPPQRGYKKEEVDPKEEMEIDQREI
eukprot:10621876-Karenia_brevis.AAC.1